MLSSGPARHRRASMFGITPAVRAQATPAGRRAVCGAAARRAERRGHGDRRAAARAALGRHARRRRRLGQLRRRRRARRARRCARGRRRCAPAPGHAGLERATSQTPVPWTGHSWSARGAGGLGPLACAAAARVQALASALEPGTHCARPAPAARGVARQPDGARAVRRGPHAAAGRPEPVTQGAGAGRQRWRRRRPAAGGALRPRGPGAVTVQSRPMRWVPTALPAHAPIQLAVLCFMTE